MEKFDNKVKLLITAYGGLVKAVNTHQLKLPQTGDSLPDWVRLSLWSVILMNIQHNQAEEGGHDLSAIKMY